VPCLRQSEGDGGLRAAKQCGANGWLIYAMIRGREVILGVKMEGKKIPFPRLQQYLRDGFVPHPVDIQTNSWFFQFNKWYFDFIKNTIVASALVALAKKTHSAPIDAIAWISFGVLNSYILLNINSWHFEPLHIFRHSRPRLAAAGLILWSITAAIVMFGAQYALLTAINAIVDGNTK
jgi:hypothetical protein